MCQSGRFQNIPQKELPGSHWPMRAPKKKKNMTNEATFMVCAAAHLLSLGLWSAFMTLNAQKNSGGTKYSRVEGSSKDDGAGDLEEDFGDVENDEAV